MRNPTTLAGWRNFGIAAAGIALITLAYRWLHITNTTTVALSYLLVVLLVAAVSRLRISILTSCVAMLCFNYFFLPPLGRLTIADPENWLALVVFLAVSLAGSQLSSIARERAELIEERKSAELARRSEELKSALLASLGHDLRTPLTAIRVAAGNLQASWLGEAERREQCQLVLAEVERLTRLFENILDMARIDVGAVATELQWALPSQIVDAARDQIQHAIGRRKIEARPDPDVLVRLDPRLTSAALAQLLENAAKYSPPEAPIEVTARVVRSELLLTVEDRGPGLSDADLPRVFDRFYRGEQAQQTTGAGMGLAIARGLVSAEGGRVWAENAATGGSRFTIAIPVESRSADGSLAVVS